ncbi:MAG: hypothetical protein AAGH53_07675 [Pseudomonadota bacterium]
MKVLRNTSKELVARHNAGSNLVWVVFPIPVLALGAVFTDVDLTIVQLLVLLGFILTLLVIVAAKIEWTTLRLDRAEQRASISRQRLFGESCHDFGLEQITKVRPDSFYHETGSVGHRLILEHREEGPGGEISAIPLVSVAQDWDAQQVADEINDWLMRYSNASEALDDADIQ